MRDKTKEEIREMIMGQMKVFLPASDNEDIWEDSYKNGEYVDIKDILIMLLNELKIEPFIRRRMIRFRKHYENQETKTPRQDR